MNTFRFAILGCGRIAPRHADCLARIEKAELVAAADSDTQRATQFGERYSVPTFSSSRELLNWGNFDVVSICTPSGLHCENALEFLRAGKHVVVEKPMALSLQDAELMIKVAAQNDRKLFVVKQNRYNPPVMALRKALQQERFGKLTLGTVRVRWSRNQSYYDRDSWRGTWAFDGGVLANQASHHIDLLLSCMGEVESVFAKTTNSLANIECEDTALVMIKFKSGAMGLIEATTATRPRDLEGSISILGEYGSVEICGFALNEMRHFQFTKELPEDREIQQMKSLDQSSVYGKGHLPYLSDVVNVLAGTSSPLVDGVEGKKSLAVIVASYISAKLGREITIEESLQLSCRLGEKT